LVVPQQQIFVVAEQVKVDLVGPKVQTCGGELSRRFVNTTLDWLERLNGTAALCADIEAKLQPTTEPAGAAVPTAREKGGVAWTYLHERATPGSSFESPALRMSGRSREHEMNRLYDIFPREESL
jgi:hypothetical protein